MMELKRVKDINEKLILSQNHSSQLFKHTKRLELVKDII